jgi:hypothetical protein
MLNIFTVSTRIRTIEFQVTEWEPGEYCSVTAVPRFTPRARHSAARMTTL